MQFIPPILWFLLASFFAGIITIPLRSELEPPRQDLGDLEGMGQSVLIGSLGGLRALAADFLWLQTNYYWQQKNHGLTETTAMAVTRLQPDFPYFWIEASRMIVYDMPVWRFGERRSPPKSVEKRIRREQAESGLKLLSEAAEFIPDSPAIPAEKARIYWTVLDDPEKAQEYYKIAYEKPFQTALYARLRALILLDLGRKQEALDWSRKVLSDMNPDQNPVQYAILEEYVRDMELGEDPRGDTTVPSNPSPAAEQAL